MFRVAIIDDEPVIRKGIKNVINWPMFDCEVCGEAGDGQEGQELIERFRPQIIITDIRMPEVDGLAMIGRVRALVPESKIIILTGYRNFEYAHAAIHLGAFDYLMKPSRIGELEAVVRRAVDELRRDAAHQDELGRLRRQYEESKPLIRERLLYNLLYGLYPSEPGAMEEAGAEAKRLGLPLERYVLGLVETETPPEEEKHGPEAAGSDAPAPSAPEAPGADGAGARDDAHLYQFGILGMVGDVLGEAFEVCCLSLGNRLSAFLLSPREGGELKNELISAKCQYLQSIIQSCFGFTVSIAVSNEGRGAAELPQRLKECREALEHKFYLGNNSIIFYHDLGTFFQYRNTASLYELQKALLDTVKAGNAEAVPDAVSAVGRAAGSAAGLDREFVRNFYFNTLTLVYSIRVALQSGSPQAPLAAGEALPGGPLPSLYSMVEGCDSASDLSDLLESVCLRAAEKVRDYNNNNMKLLLRRAVEYITTNYQSDLTLGDVAEHVYVSPFYISRMFKKELGINFVDYLGNLRIEKAKELLADAHVKAYEVAQAVGIPNAHYFSKLFRKYAGITPSEYRDSLWAGEGAAPAREKPHE